MNKITKVFDSIGFNFNLSSDNFVVISPLKGYNSLDTSHIGYYIPYLVRGYNSDNTIDFEVGVGLVKVDENETLYVARDRVVKSSNNDNKVNFKNNARKEFYIFANQSSFDTGFNNVLIHDSSFTIEPIQASYLVDTTENTVDAILPDSSKSNNVIIELKLVGGNNGLVIRDNDGHILMTLGLDNNYTRLTCKNNTWYELKNTDSNYGSFSSMSDPSFGIQSDPAGDLYSFQYKSGSSSFDGASVYWSSGGSNKILLGDDVESTAHTILPTSGTASTIFNNDRQNSDFLVYGSGTRNMFFGYDGRLGINIPSGSRPLTIFHVVNTICQEGFRLENRNPCHPANMTLYHIPSGSLTNGDIVSEINLAGKDTNGNRVNYARLQSRALDWTAATPKGQFDVVVATTSTGIRTIQSNPDYTTIGYSNNNLTINNAGNTIVGYSGSKITLASNSITASSPAVNLQSVAIVLGSGGTGTVNAPSIFATSLQSDNIRIPSIAAGNILAINSSGYIDAASSSVKFSSIPSGYLLSTSANGAVTGIYTTDSFFLTEQDLTWNKYQKRTANICLRQIVLTETTAVEEFVVGDQIAVITPTQTYYRTVVSVDVLNNNIVGLLVNQTLTENTVTDVEIYSITRGGYLLMQMYVEPGTTADATSNILSIRPSTDTVFNTAQKDIDFIIYGVDEIASLSVKANSGRTTIQSGIYYDYSTQTDTSPFAIPVNSGGDGTSSANNTANYNYTASGGSYSGLVTTVGSNGLPSYYGTYDQNGNAAEWVEDLTKISLSTTQYAAGGSFRSDTVSGLRGYIPYVYSGSHDAVGFRVCGAYGLIDVAYISDSDKLNLDFVPVADSDNIQDSSNIYTVSAVGVEPTGNNLIASGINNLGIVNRNYRIGTYEITNDQYVKFLNVTASGDTYGLYDTNMGSTNVGGITRSGSDGSYTYASRTNMGNKPAVYIDYLSAIRFANWLHNGAPTGNITSATTEDGAYNIFSLGANSYQITKNNYQKYWLPNIHEWYKAAYFKPVALSASSGTSSVLVKSDSPYLVASGTTNGVPYSDYASLTVSGWLYADHLVLGDKTFVGPTGTGINNASLVSRTVVIESGNHHKVTIGKPNNVIINTGNTDWDGTYGNIIGGTGIELSSSGTIDIIATDQITIYSPLPIKASGITATALKAQVIQQVDAEGDPVPTYPGSSGDIVCKGTDYTAITASQFKFIDYKLNMPSGKAYSPLYLNATNYVLPFSGLEYTISDSTSLVTLSGNLIVDKIRIGPELPFYSGSILTHNGTGFASWQASNYLKAEGMSWNRYTKRPVDIYEHRIVFTDNATEAELETEFEYTDTIALINAATLEPYYIKASQGYIVVDGSGVALDTDIVKTGDDGFEITFCPQSPWEVVSGVPVSGYAYAVTKGAYLSMQIDPAATSGFDCNNTLVANNASPYSFKPSTLNRISIRPETHTAFNLLAEDIDFVVYGQIKTPYNRYQPALFGQDSHGIPSGLVAGFKVDANIQNAVSGTLATGVIFSGYTDIGATIPSGYKVDERPKICINTNNAYSIASITSGVGKLEYYADLTVSGVTYTSGLIVEDIYLKPTPTLGTGSKYVVNAPLTVNTYGQIVSQVPESAPSVPGSPTGLTGTPGFEGVFLSWTAPTNNGGRVIINYIIEYSANGGSTWTKYARDASIDTSASLTNLVNGVAYIFRVSAVNSVGTGAPSSVSSSITPSSARPSQVKDLAATRDTLSAILTWNQPEYSTTAITDYVVEYSSNNGLTWTVFSDGVSSSTGATITGLNDATRYLFRVKALNSAGYGIYAQIASLGTDPYTPPSDTNDDTSLWDFGKITFTGVCL